MYDLLCRTFCLVSSKLGLVSTEKSAVTIVKNVQNPHKTVRVRECITHLHIYTCTSM